jgi:hypothetical protein
MLAKPFRESRATVVLFFLLSCMMACGREPGLIVNIAAWPNGVERIRVRTTVDGARGTDIFLNKDQTRFVVRMPTGSQGTVQLDATGLDVVDCALAKGRLTEPVPDNLSRFVERTLEFETLQTPVCVFADATYFDVGMTPSSVAVGDFNSDMKLDLAVTNAHSLSNNVSVLLGNGEGVFATAVNYPTGKTPQSVAVGDFNGDLMPDLVVANFDDSNVSVLLGYGKGVFASATTVSYPMGIGPVFVAVGDFNSDRQPDLVVANALSNYVTVLLNIKHWHGSFRTRQKLHRRLKPQVGGTWRFQQRHETRPRRRKLWERRRQRVAGQWPRRLRHPCHLLRRWHEHETCIRGGG